ncbi:MAG: hypothetical protein R3228_18280, partial [Halioglobus sp.]|nr:hypothetical protein [Halioglobus sp.]
MKINTHWLLLCGLLPLVVACSDGDDRLGPPLVPAPPLDCDPLTPSYCGFPYPNNYWTAADPGTVTGLRLALPQVIMPRTVTDLQSSPDAFNEMDGFSAGIAAMTHMPGATVAGLASPAMIEASLSMSSPTVILNAETGERLAHWAELDEYVVQSRLRQIDGEDAPGFDVTRDIDELRAEQALMLRPAVRPEDATRYIVAIRNVLDEQGNPLPPSGGFRALRDGENSGSAIIESRRPHFEELFATLEAAGIARDDLQLAWDFTTASRENNTRAMLHMRDEALANYADGVPYSIELGLGDPPDGVACRLEVSFDVPLYMTKGQSGGLLNLGEDGLPEQNGSFTYAAALIVPMSAQTEAAPLVAFGHGQLGRKEQVLGTQALSASENLALFGLDWKG